MAGRSTVVGILGALLLALSGLLPACGASGDDGGPPGAAIPPDQQIVVGNAAVRRTLLLEKGRVRTVRFENRITGDAFPVEDDTEEVALRLQSGRRLTGEDFVAHRVERILAGDLPAQDARSRLPAGTVVACTLSLLGPDGWRAEARYFVRDEHPELYKRIRLVPPPGDEDRLMEVEVERLAVGAETIESPLVPREITDERQTGPDLRYRGGLGLGQPLYLEERVFAGLEHPGGANTLEQGVVSLRQFPGMRLSILPAAGFTSETAVWGLSPPGEVVQGFRAYLKRTLRPAQRQRNFIDAFHLRGRANIGVGINAFPSPEELEAMYEEYPVLRELVRTEENAVAYAGKTAAFASRYGIPLDSFAVDGGWQNARTVFEIDDFFLPNGFHPLVEASEVPLGLWNSLAGFRLDLDSLSDERGFQICPPIAFSFDLSQPAYLDAIKGAIRSLAEAYGVVYWKQDFNAVVCDIETPRHPAEDAQSFEANVNALIEIIALERELNPGVFIAQTTFIWPSPWWLLHVDAVPALIADYGYLRDRPAFYPRDWHIDFVDAAQHGFFVKDRSQYPTSRVMTHGIIHDRYVHLGGDRESLASWANGVVAHLAPGMALQELYVDPDMLPDAHARFLAQAFRWADANEEQLFDFGEMFGGDPKAGAPYGFLHGEGRRRLAFLRNPSHEPRVAEVPLGELPGEARVQVLYPRLELLPGAVSSDEPPEIELGPYEVVLLRVLPEDEVPDWMAEGVTYGALGEDSLHVHRLPDGEPAPPAAIPHVLSPELDGVLMLVPPGARAWLQLIVNRHDGTEVAVTRNLQPLGEADMEVSRGPCGPLGCPLVHIDEFAVYRVPLPPLTFQVGWDLDPETSVHAVWLESLAEGEVEEVPVEVAAPLFPTPGFMERRDWSLVYFQEEEIIDPLLPVEPLRGDFELTEFSMIAPLPAVVDVEDKAGGTVLLPMRIDPEAGTVTLTGTGSTVGGSPTLGVVALNDVPAVGTVTLTLGDYPGAYDPETGAQDIPMAMTLEAGAFGLVLNLEITATTGRASASRGEVTAEAQGHVLSTDYELRLAGAGLLPPDVPLVGNQPFAVTLSGTVRPE